MSRTKAAGGPGFTRPVPWLAALSRLAYGAGACRQEVAVEWDRLPDRLALACFVAGRAALAADANAIVAEYTKRRGVGSSTARSPRWPRAIHRLARSAARRAGAILGATLVAVALLGGAEAALRPVVEAGAPQVGNRPGKLRGGCRRVVGSTSRSRPVCCNPDKPRFGPAAQPPHAIMPDAFRDSLSGGRHFDGGHLSNRGAGGDLGGGIGCCSLAYHLTRRPGRPIAQAIRN